MRPIPFERNPRPLAAGQTAGAGGPGVPPRQLRPAFGALFLATGAALLVYIVSGTSLLAALGLTLGGGTAVGAVLWRRTPPLQQAQLRRRLGAGLFAGLVATGAYDLARYLLVEVANSTFWPFDTLTKFGQALLGTEERDYWVIVAGVAYHLANGVCFGVAYTVWLGRRGVWAGVAWALVLETAMVTIYPGWLGLKALDEFLRISVLGHVVYGSVLGATAQQLLVRQEQEEHGRSDPEREG